MPEITTHVLTPRAPKRPANWHDDDLQELSAVIRNLVWWLTTLQCTDTELVAQVHAVHARILEILAIEYEDLKITPRRRNL